MKKKIKICLGVMLCFYILSIARASDVNQLSIKQIILYLFFGNLCYLFSIIILGISYHRYVKNKRNRGKDFDYRRIARIGQEHFERLEFLRDLENEKKILENA